MVHKINSKKGRPLAKIKVRGIRGMTPKGFEMDKIKREKIFFKRK